MNVKNYKDILLKEVELKVELKSLKDLILSSGDRRDTDSLEKALERQTEVNAQLTVLKWLLE
jgi:CHAD domain-containing protein